MRTIPILIKALKREGSNTLCSSLLLSIYMSYMLSMYLYMFKSLPPTLNTNQPTNQSHHLVNTAETWQEVSNYNCVCIGHLIVHFNSLQIKGKKIMLSTCSFQAVKVKSIHHLEQRVCYPTPHWNALVQKKYADKLSTWLRAHRIPKDRNELNFFHFWIKLPTLRAVMPWAAHARRDMNSSYTKPACRAQQALIFWCQPRPIAPGARGTLVLRWVLCAWWAVVTNWAWSRRLLSSPCSCKNKPNFLTEAMKLLHLSST